MKEHTGTLTLSAGDCEGLIEAAEAHESVDQAVLGRLYGLERTLLRMDVEMYRSELNRHMDPETLDQ